MKGEWERDAEISLGGGHSRFVYPTAIELNKNPKIVKATA